MKAYFITYGYSNRIDKAKLLTDYDIDEIYDNLVEMAYEEADSNMPYEEDEDVIDREMAVQDALRYSAVEWNEELHAPECTYGVSNTPNTMIWD